MAYNYLRTYVDQFREAVAPLRHTSNFRETGQLTPEEFVHAGDYLVYKFPSWSWSDAASPSKRVAHFPDGKQFLVTRGVPCRRRLGGSNAQNNLVEGDQQLKDVMIKGEDGEDWLSAGEFATSGNDESRAKEVKSIDDSDKLGDVVGDDDENIPDMEDYDEEDDDAIIRDKPQLDE
jgi:ubiquitin-like-conjugating enzyme ATG3